MMSRRSLLLAFLTAVQYSAQAADEPQAHHEPDHLVPVVPNPGQWHDPYSDMVCSRLSLPPFFFAEMVVMPSFSGEYAVRLHGATNDVKRTERFFVSYSGFDKNMAFWMRLPNVAKRRPAISARTVELSKPLALRVYQLWQKMLQRTRKADEQSAVADGTGYEFAVGHACGATVSPSERNSPFLLVELGQSLVDYCKAAPAERAAAAQKIEDKTAQLDNYLSEHPLK